MSPCANCAPKEATRPPEAELARYPKACHCQEIKTIVKEWMALNQEARDLRLEVKINDLVTRLFHALSRIT